MPNSLRSLRRHSSWFLGEVSSNRAWHLRANHGAVLNFAGHLRVLHDLPTTLRITDWTYSQIAMANGLTWEKGRTMVPLRSDWERELRGLIEKAA